MDLNAPLDQLIVLLKTITGLVNDADGTAHVRKGEPESYPTRLMAYVALAGFPETEERATQIQGITAYYAIGFGYRVAGAEAEAETALCTAVLAFLQLMVQGTNRRLNNGTVDLVDDARLVSQGNAGPQYALLAGQDNRLVLALVRTTQRQQF
jgi:hypothetical protein